MIQTMHPRSFLQPPLPGTPEPTTVPCAAQGAVFEGTELDREQFPWTNEKAMVQQRVPKHAVTNTTAQIK